MFKKSLAPYIGIAIILVLGTIAACGPESAPQPQPTPMPTSNATATPTGGNLEIGNCGSYRETDNILTNGDLEAPSVSGSSQTFETGSSFTNWRVDLGSVALLAGGFAKPSGNQALALGGTVSQQVSAFVGKTYQLSFCYGTTPGATSGGVEVKWEGASAGTLALDAATNQPAFKGVKIKLIATTSRPTVSINGSGAIIDAVRLELLP